MTVRMILKLNYGEVGLLLLPSLQVIIRPDCPEFSSLARTDKNIIKYLK